MRTIITPIIAFIFYSSIRSQSLHDINWITGYSYLYYDTVYNIVIGGSIIDFRNNPPDTSSVNLATKDVVGIISNKDGKLVAYSDGCYISNKDHEIMVNGDFISPGPIYDSYCGASGYPAFQNPLFLPLPGSQDKYYLFHVHSKNPGIRPYELLYSIVDASEDILGIVIAKNQIAWGDALLNCYVTATRHANGRDWWVVAPRRTSSGYHVGLLTPEGFEDKGTQSVGVDTARLYYCCGQTAFSPDGSKYFKHIPRYGVEVLDFDRCTGQFSNSVELDFSADNGGMGNGRGGVAAAPGGRYLYVTTALHILQYDLWAGDLAASCDTVAVWDGFMSPFSTPFYQLALAPNGKLYIVTGSTNNVLHVIHQPDSAGLACQVEQHGLSVPTLTGWFAPNFPNFNLGALAGSPCDTIPADTTIYASHLSTASQQGLRAYPNPAWETLHLAKGQGSFGQAGVLRVYSAAGALRTERRLTANDLAVNISLENWPPGLYWWQVVWADGRREAGAFVKE